MTAQKRFAVFGNPASASLSPHIHRHFARQLGITLDYDIVEPAESDFETQVREFFRAGGAGANVTLPFKERALALADSPSERAIRAGAANTLWPSDEGGLIADNTDGEGLVADLARLGVEVAGRTLLILGAGGAARGILPALLEQKPGLVVIANRHMARAQTLAERFADMVSDILIATADPALVADRYDLVLHATAFGRADGDELEPNLPPMFAAALERAAFCYDLNYTPEPGHPTALCAAADRADVPSADGLGMLVQQAAAAFALWHGVSPNAAQTFLALQAGEA